MTPEEEREAKRLMLCWIADRIDNARITVEGIEIGPQKELGLRVTTDELQLDLHINQIRRTP